MSVRINIDSKDHELYKFLSEKSREDPEGSPFLLMKNVFMWAVSIGVKKQIRRPLSSKKEQIFSTDIFSENIEMSILKAIAVSETGNVEVLTNEDEIIRIAEEYANEGIHHLRHELMEKPGERLWNLVNLIREENI